MLILSVFSLSTLHIHLKTFRCKKTFANCILKIFVVSTEQFVVTKQNTVPKMAQGVRTSLTQILHIKYREENIVFFVHLKEGNPKKNDKKPSNLLLYSLFES
jgi:hypothetical protein